MSGKRQSDVLVLGAGPTGCAAAITLANAGLDVCIVDRATFPRDKTCGDAISNNGMALVERLGAADFVREVPQALVERAAAIFPDGSRLTREYERPGYIVPRYGFDDCLRRALERSGARLLQGQHVSALVRGGNFFTGAIGPSFQWTSKVIIAADGYGSVAHKALDLEKLAPRQLAVSATAYYRDVSFPHGAATSDHFFDRGLPYGYGWIFPAVEGISNVGVFQRVDAYTQGGRRLVDVLSRFVARHAARFSGATLVGKPRAWSLPIAPAPTPLGAPGLILAGDAAGLIDPLSGEGIWQGLHSGILAAEATRAALARGAPDSTLLRAYARRVRADVIRPSRGKAVVQRALAIIVETGLYRSDWVKAVLGWGYRGGVLEMTKS